MFFGYTALHCAGNVDVVAALLAGGANVHAVDVRTTQTAWDGLFAYDCARV